MEAVNVDKQRVDGFSVILSDYERKCWLELYKALCQVQAKDDHPKCTEDAA